MPKTYPFYRQPDQMDCGPTCLRMVAAHHGRRFSIQTLREHCQINKEGVSMLGIAEAAERIGLLATGAKVDLEELHTARLPCIVHWDQKHFVVLYRIRKRQYILADPAKGVMTYSEEEFMQHWLQGRKTGVALMLETTPEFYGQEGDELKGRTGFSTFMRYVFKYKRLLVQLGLGFAIGSLLQLLLPFLTQSVVDVGIGTQDLHFVHLVLIAQFMLLLGRTSVDFIRSWILLHISIRLNIYILTAFLGKLMRLPISFFDSKKTGDIMQRMNDQKRIETFLTGQSLGIAFSLFNLVVFSVVLAFYNLSVFAVFLAGSSLYTAWILAFLGKRKQLDHKRFDIASKNQSTTIQLIQGMQEIKLSGSEKQKRWDWEHVQARLFKFNVRSLALGQYQQAGSLFINEGKNLFIIYLVAQAVISGDLTLGAMMAIQYILGQLNSPVEQFLGFVQGYQDAKISMERLNEINAMDEEEEVGRKYLHELPAYDGIHIKGLRFSYPGAGNEPVLRDIDLQIPRGKTTAIVGMSGSGKTTLIKMLLGFYKPHSGEISLGNTDLQYLSPRFWRMQCGVVMQDTFIFSDTIAANIAVSEGYPDTERLRSALKLACLEEFVRSLPLGIHTQIGAEGNGISQGQKQRLLIARAIYKNPDFIFLDEATNALDANNEKMIVENLQSFFEDRTVVVVAHRLSTVKHADNIVVLDQGKIVEQGTHEELTKLKGSYYRLVSNQLEMALN